MRTAMLHAGKASTLAASAVAGIAMMMAGPIHAADAPPHAMSLGPSAPAPPGYLAFCARTPDQCGLSDGTDAQGRPIGAEQLSRNLYSKYYWSAVFAGGASLAAPTPSSSRASSAAKASNAFRGSPSHRTWNDTDPLGATAGAVSPIEANGGLLAELDRVNLQVNRAIHYVSDKALYGDEDYWHLALGPGEPAAGDCKDYVLEKRRALVADGVPAANLSIAIVETTWHESHAVLLVDTDRGEMVLDSLSDWIKPWWKANYSWVERQAPGQQLSWVSIG
jgi:predicted transglutaminase-like cysteine proteinase